MTITGASLIDGQPVLGKGESFHAIQAGTGASLSPAFPSCGEAELEKACALAAEAFQDFSQSSGQMRGKLLRAIASEISGAGDALVERATEETGLPEARIRGETGRTVGQLQLFAALVEEGSWVDARIETAQPDRSPLPKPDLRAMQRPLGPVAVFCASNFPLAFSVAGGDTAAALAAGCPVVVKAHRSHPGTAEIVGRCVVKALEECGMPRGIFALLQGPGNPMGGALVAHPAITAVGFTGSRAAGKTLMRIASERDRPIPVYAEMSSINPLVLLPGALAARPLEIAQGLQGSATLGAGQFCTNPGVVFYDGSDTFREAFVAQMADTPPACMLHPGIRDAYEAALEKFCGHASVKRLTQPYSGDSTPPYSVRPVVLETTAGEFARHPELTEEIFGPGTLLVRYEDKQDLLKALVGLEGQLTATIHAEGMEWRDFDPLLALLRDCSGRLIFNQFPTGVEVCHAMVHGGPYPSSSDGRSTSVGTLAIERFTRPAAYQNCPEEALPPELRDGNPLGIRRLVDGSFI